MTTEMIISKIAGLQSKTATYSEGINAFVGNGYTSSAGNHYFNAVRFAEGILIKEDIGVGYLHTFLNGIKIYSLKDKTLIVDQTYHCKFYSKEESKSQSRSLLLDQLEAAARQQHFSFNREEAKSLIHKIVEDAFVVDQREMADMQLHRLTL